MSTCKIRLATHDDVAGLIPIMDRFHEWAPIPVKTKLDNDALVSIVKNIIDNGAIYIAASDNVIVGFLVGVITSTWYNPNTRVAAELAWWVDDSHKNSGVGIKLLKSFEKWSKLNNADVVVVSDFIKQGFKPAGQMLERLGYGCFERSFTKFI